MSVPAVAAVAGFTLSPQQARLWALAGGEETAPYRSCGAVLIEGPLDADRLARALADLVARFEILRTSFRQPPEMAVPLQVVHDHGEVRFARHAPLAVDGEGWQGAVEELLARAGQEAEDPARSSPAAFSLLPLGAHRHVLTIALPALCCDRLGLRNLVGALQRAYEAGGGATGDELQLADLAQWQNEVLASADARMGADYFRETGAAAAASRLPLPRRSAAGRFTPAAVEVPLDPGVGARLAGIAEAEGVPLDALLLAAWQALLARLTGEPAPPIAVCLDGRNYAELEEAVGPFEKYLPVSGAPLAEAELPLTATARRLAAVLDDLRRWQECFAWESSLGLAPDGEPFFFPAAFELVDRTRLRERFSDRSGAGVTFSLLAERCLSERFEVRIAAARDQDGIALQLDYDASRFDLAEVAALGERLAALLASFAARPELEIGRLDVVPEGERHRLLEQWSGAAARVASGPPGCAHERFEEAARCHPERTALVCEETRLRYADLDALANRIARRLRRSGVGPEVAVGLSTDRTPALIAGILGIWKAGGAYVPLDPELPAGRLRLLVEDAGVRVVLDAGQSARELDLGAVEVIRLGPDGEEMAGESAAPLPGAAGPESLAYVLFTSGSTGRPKGVAVEHRQLTSYLDGVLPRLGLPDGASFACVSTLAADLGHTAIFPALTTGGCLHLIAQERCTDPNAFRDYAAGHAIDCLKIVPGHLQALLAGARPEQVLPRRLLVLGGEASRWDLVDLVRGLAPGCAVLNHYGPTEATVGALTCAVPGGYRPPTATVPLGRPLATATVYLLDRFGEPVPAGAPGEVCLGGGGLARGYHGRPELTAAAFVPHPWGSPGERLYRTGDRARFLPDGSLEFLGRADHQVKIRGFRIELGEIAAVLERHPAVRACFVTAPVDEAGERRLVAYVETGGEAVAAGALRAHLEGLLPAAMIPAVFVVLDRLPRTANGKVDFAALPPPQERPDTAEAAPSTPTEERLAALWKRLLGVERLGIEQSFFDLGGHSLLAMRLVSQVSEAFGVDVPLRTFVETPTLAGMAAAIDRAEEVESGPRLPVLVPDPARRHQPFPLTDVQQAYWIGRSGSFELGNVATHAYLEFDLPVLDVERFEAALRRVVDRHEMLRTVILPSGEQQILPEVPPYEIGLADLRAVAPEEAAARLEEIRQRMSHQVLPTDRWPLFEVRVSRLAEDRFRVHVSSDALVRDAWSFRIISEDLLAVYVDPDHRFEPLEASFRDYVLAEAAFADSAVYRRSLEHWQERLATLPPAPQLPLAQSPASLAQPRFTGRRGTLDRAAWERLKARGSRIGLSPTGLLLAVFSEVLAVWSKSPRFTVNLTLFNRFPIHPQVDRVVGDFTSLLLVGIDGSGRGSFEERARRVQERLWEDLDHRHVSGVKVLRELMRKEGSAGRAAMPVVFTSVLGLTAEEEAAESPLQAEQVYAINQTPQVWLDHLVLEERGALIYQWATVEELFPPGLVDDMFAAFGRLLAALAAGEESWSAAVPDLVPAEQLARRAAVNATAAPVSPERLDTLFLAQAARDPDRSAVIAPERTLTYGELERWSRHLAGRLRRLGARPGRLVAVVMEKGWEQVAAALGVLRAGAAYLPIDADLPPERLRLLLARGEVGIALVQPGVEERVDWPDGIARLPVAGPAPDAVPGDAEDLGPEPAGGPEDLAYVIFTSGSTGEPKGVMIDHRGAVNTVLDVNRRFGVGPGDRVLALSALNFDLSVYDLFGLLAAGGAVVLPPPSALRDPAAWTRLATTAGVTLWNTVPALMEMWVEYLESHRGAPPEGLRLALLSGDWIPVGLPDRIRALFPRAGVISLGGATEASIWSILYPVGAVDPAWKSIPYGRPMANQTFHVLDETGRPRADWVPGDLLIGGIGLALGYWRDEEKTAAAFVHLTPGERLYRTGDLGRYLPSGDIEFLGREDLQVKVQGHRIELGEIEAALGQHPAVQACAVTAPAAPGGGPRRLAACVVARQRPAPAAEELRDFLSGKLPAYMVPGAWTFLDALPLSANGKVDRSALPLPEAPPPPAPAESTEASGIALRIAELVARALRVERVDPNASLLELGASSIDMVRIANLLEDEFGFRPRMNDLFRFSIVGAVSEYYQALLARGEVYAGQGEPRRSADGPPWAADGLLRDPEERDRFKKRQPGRRWDLAERARVPLARGPADETALAAYLDRRSHRRFAAEALPVADFGTLLACLRQVSLNAAPKYRYASAGGLYPVQTYLYVKPGRVEGVAAGTYYHDPVEHSLVLLDGEARIEGSVYGWISQPLFEAAAFAVYLIAQAGAIVPMYGERSRDFSLLEAGLIAQLLETEAASRGIGLCQIGGVEFDRLRPLFALDEGHALLHSLVGGPLDRDFDAEFRRTAELAGWEEGRL